MTTVKEMTFAELVENLDPAQVGCEMHRLIEQLYPICRSITGDGVRESLAILQQQIPLDVHEVPTGTPVFDWTVPKEWNIRAAYIKDPQGNRVVDFADSSLHIVNYSIPIHTTMSLAELKQHLHTIPEHPDWIPYRTSYYRETWGFCLTQKTLDELADGEYEVYIDATLEPGHLTYGEYFLPGEARTRFSSRVIAAIRRSATTTCPAWPWWQRWPVAGTGSPTLFIPVPVPARHHRRHHLAESQRSPGESDQAWTGGRLCRRCRTHDLQAQPAGRR